MTSVGRSLLDDGKNNSRDAESGAQSCSAPEGGSRSTEQTRIGRFGDRDDRDDQRYDCRVTYRNMELEAHEQTAPFRCGSWDCYCCAHRMRMNLIESLEELVEQRPEMRRLLTLTVSSDQGPAGQDAQHKHLTDRFNALRTELTDRYPGLSYVWIRHEGDEKGRPHLHLLVDRFLPQDQLSKLARRVGLGRVVDIRRVNARNAAKYLTSYLGRGALANLPDGLRRYGSSQDIRLGVRGGDGDSREWRLMMDDYQITSQAGEPLRREVTNADLYLQKERGGPVGLPPPD